MFCPPKAWVTRELDESMSFPEKRKIPNRMEGRVGVRRNIDSTACSPWGRAARLPIYTPWSFWHLSCTELAFQCTREVS